ncbi:MAG TPA: LCP family protein [Microbacterium sp.]|uniref:LCP family protein n=1 Tax=Microbacterium sp. TaxID=51671 RepID=UPI002B4A2167|nr:LCP family protein [Microbacterium sp.]HKT55665.1 LCP family protein [Microbacterium sp.]
MPKPTRYTVAQHGMLPTPSPLKQAVKLLLVAIAVLLVATTSVGAFLLYDLSSTYKGRAVTLEDQPTPPASDQPAAGSTYTAMTGGVNVLLVGTDICEASYAQELGKRCTGPQANYTSANNDVNVLLHISDNPRRVTVISFPRDMIIPTPSCERPDGGTAPATSASMLNSTYSYGGLSCVAKTISALTGIGIPYAASITFGGVINVTDAIGGVQVCVANGIDDPYTHLHLSPGMHTVKGLEALQFLRTRHGLVAGSDLARISNQQQYMSRLVRQLVDGGELSNPVTLYKLASALVRNITPSDTLTDPATLVRIALAVKSVPFDQIVMLQYPTVADPHNANRVLPNTDAAAVLFTALKANKQLKITSLESPGYGVVPQVTTGGPSPSPSGSGSGSGSGSASPSPSATPGDEVALPSTISGTTAADNTCANGNRR